MDVVLIQNDIEWLSADENRTKLKTLLSSEKGADLYVLPEMFSTGFCLDPSQAVDTRGKTLHWMQSMAASLSGALAGTVVVHNKGKYFNRAYFVCPDGPVYIYDKHHLFTYGGEDQKYSPGKDRLIVDYRGWRILLQTCYDLRFPCFSRNYLNQDQRPVYDAAIYMASWPSARIEVWDVLLRARAIENQVYVLGANRVGSDTISTYCGHSGVVDFKGRLVAQANEWCEDKIRYTIDKIALLDFREKFPVLQSADVKY